MHVGERGLCCTVGDCGYGILPGHDILESLNNVGKCQFYANPPPPPQPPSEGAILQMVIELFTGTAVDDAQAQVAAIQAAIEAATPATATAAIGYLIELAILAGSSTIRSTQTFASEADQSAASDTLTTSFGTAEAANAYLASAGVNVNVLNTNVYKQNIASADDDNVAVIVGATVGGFFGCLCLVAGAVMIKRKQSKVEA